MSNPNLDNPAAAAWRARASELAEKFDEWVMRRDVWGGYLPIDLRPKKERTDGSTYTQAATTKPAKDKRGLVSLTLDVIRRHCAGMDPGDIIGLHSIGPDQTSIRFACEVDAHDGQPCDREANWKAALFLFDYLTSLGLDVLLTDSNGNGGYHVQGTLEMPIPAPQLYAFLTDAASKYTDREVKIETFPKQRSLTTERQFGNWLRLPGRHHTREHWTRVWNSAASSWLEGADAVDAILRLKPNPVHLIPVLKTEEPAPARKPHKWSTEPGDGNRMSEREVALECLKRISPDIGYDDWLAVGQALHSVGTDLEAAWIDWSRGSGKFIEGECSEKWKTFNANGKRTIATIVHMAQQTDTNFLKPGSRSNGRDARPRPQSHDVATETGDTMDTQDPDAPDTDVIDQAIEAKDIKALYGAVSVLAKLEHSDFAIRKNELKAAFGKDLNLNDLQRAVKEEKRKLRKANRKPRLRRSGANLPSICISGRQMREITDDALAALSDDNDPPTIFMRTGSIVSVRRDEKNRLQIHSVNEHGLRGRLERSANFYSVGKEEEEVIESPPMENCRDILNLDVHTELERLGKPQLPALEAVVEAPIVRSDGTILASPGYDAATRLYFAPTSDVDGVKVPMDPTPKQLRDAVELIEETIGEFPFEDEASKANAYAALIGPCIRPALVGRVPLAIFDKPQPGTGGSLLAEAIAAIATGREACMYGAPDDDAEWRKLITSILRTGETNAIIDNVEHSLESDPLARVITCGEWGDRILGESKDVRLPARAVWMVTGNNVQLGRNLARRCFWIRLNARLSRPWQRDGFRHPNLIEWILAHRGRILGAVLTICRAWYAAGKPQAPGPVLGSFENWSKTVGGILAHAGVHGFLGNLEQMHSTADEETPQWEAFLIAWRDTYGDKSITVAQIERDIANNVRLRESLPDDLGAMIEHRPGQAFNSETYQTSPRFKLRLGKALQKRADMRFGDGLYITRGADDSDRKVATWRCSRGVRGVSGSALTPPHAHAYPPFDDVYAKGVCAHDIGQAGDSPPSPVLPVKPSDLPEYWLEFYNERTAILEFDGGLTPVAAADKALIETLQAMQHSQGVVHA